MNRRRMIRRGATYGPPLPEGAPRGRRGARHRRVRDLREPRSASSSSRRTSGSTIKNFHELGNERDPIIGNQDGTLEFKIPKRPIRKKITGLPAFTTVRGGAYFFLPGLKALRYLATLGRLNSEGHRHDQRERPAAPTTRTTCRAHTRAGKRRFSIYWTWSYPWEANRDVTELDNRFSTMTEVRRVGWPNYRGHRSGTR